MTKEPYQHTVFPSSLIEVTVESNCPIKIQSIIIGSLQNFTGSADCYIKSVTFNQQNIQNTQSTAVHEYGSAELLEVTVDITLTTDPGVVSFDYYNSGAVFGHIDIIPKNSLILRDDNLELKLTAKSPMMPIFGIKYTLE